MTPENLQEASDEELMREYKLGSDEAFGELYRRHAGRLYGYLRKKVGGEGKIDDIFQETLLRLHRNRSRYDPTLPFLPWLFTICHSALVDRVRKDGRTMKLGEELRSLETRNDPGVERASSMDPLRRSYATLSPEEREILSLRYAGELSFDEIAARLEIRPANARKISSRSIRKLRELLKLNV